MWWVAASLASEGGRVGSADSGCAPCHGSLRSPLVDANLEVSDVGVVGGTEIDAAVVVRSDGQSVVGVDLAAAGGTLVPEGGLRQVGDELTHGSPLPMTDGELRVAFRWVLPEEPGTYTLIGSVNAADGDGTPAGDRWAVARPLTVRVDPACVDQDGDGVDACDGDCDDPASTVSCEGDPGIAEDGPAPEPRDGTGCHGGNAAVLLGLLYPRRHRARTITAPRP
ncbi:MAG: choice-of-anchor V domain-containing protein [Myxococcota bacterium]